MSQINRTTRVHLIASAASDNRRCYLAKIGTKRNWRGDLILDYQFDDDPSLSQPMPYEYALVIQRRLLAESDVVVRFALQAGNTAELIEN